MQERIDKLEKRIAKLEGERNDVVQIGTESLRLAKLTRLEGQETKAIVGRIEIVQGDTNERLDTLERGQTETNNRLSTMEKKQDAHTEVLGQLLSVVKSHDERFSSIDTKLDQILARLPEQK